MADNTAHHPAQPGARSLRRGCITKVLIALVSLLAPLTLIACALAPMPSSGAVVTQGQLLPTLRHLDWGFAAINHPVWSPDGRWIAVLAGDDYAGAHVEVVSPDGQTKYDLSSWHCGEGSDPDFAWLPDGRLSCINGDTPYPRMCIGAAPFSSCMAVHLSQVIIGSQWGVTWTPSGQAALFAARPNDGSGANTELYVVTPAGVVQQELTSADQYDAAAPSFRPHAAQLAYYRGASVDSGGYDHFDLVISPFSQVATGRLTLGSARTIATEQHPDMSLYAWSPSGRWLVVRYADYQGGDRIYLVNPDNSSQTLDVVSADLAQQQMTDPIWSPDGKTLIVFGVNDQQPYAIDIASYLASKGLQP